MYGAVDCPIGRYTRITGFEVAARVRCEREALMTVGRGVQSVHFTFRLPGAAPGLRQAGKAMSCSGQRRLRTCGAFKSHDCRQDSPKHGQTNSIAK